MYKTAMNMPNLGDKKNAQFNYRAVGIGIAIAPLSYALLRNVEGIGAYLLLSSLLGIVFMMVVPLVMWKSSRAQQLDPELRRRIYLVPDFVVNLIFGHGFAFVVIRFTFQIIARYYK